MLTDFPVFIPVDQRIFAVKGFFIFPRIVTSRAFLIREKRLSAEYCKKLSNTTGTYLPSFLLKSLNNIGIILSLTGYFVFLRHGELITQMVRSHRGIWGTSFASITFMHKFFTTHKNTRYLPTKIIPI